MSTAVNQSERQGGDWLSFEIGSQLYAVSLREVSEVIRESGLTPVPGAAADLLGIIHLRGRIVPVLDGRLRLGLPGLPVADPTCARIVMLSHAGHTVGLLVDSVGELLHADATEIQSPPAGRAIRADDPVSGVLSWRGGFVALLDAGRLCRLTRENDHVA